MAQVAAATDLAVATHGLVRDYGHGAGLHGIDLAVPHNDVYGLIGPNGAGKTTLLSILAGLRHADSGRIELNVAARKVAMCPDTPEFEPWLTASEVIRQSHGLAAQHAGNGLFRRPSTPHSPIGSNRDHNHGRDADPVARALGRVGLTDAANRRCGGFSRGMKQRLSLAAALTLNPDLLLLDEPSSALDPAGRAELFQLIGELAVSRTVIFSSHILDDVQRVAGSVGVLDQGRLLFQGPTQTLIDSYLRPTWNLRVRGDARSLIAQFRGLPWVTRVLLHPDDSIELEAANAETGEREIPRVVIAAGAGIVSMNPVDASLEAAFLALTTGNGTNGAPIDGRSEAAT